MDSGVPQLEIGDLELDRFVMVANKAVDLAAEVLRKYFENREAFQVFDKTDENGCVVEQGTTADLAAEDAIVSTILEHFPGHLVFGEEKGWRPEKKHGDYVWVIDPIDGTTSFMNGIPLFGILVALLYKSKPILGIIDQPILKKRWLGVHGRRTIVDGVSTNTRTCEHLSRATLYTSSPSHFSDEELKAFVRVKEKVKEESYGAECFHYGQLASGFIDIVIQSFLGPYDFLAFIPIIEGAGGVITDWKGDKLHWEASPTFAGPPYYSIIASGDERVHQQALEYLKERQ